MPSSSSSDLGDLAWLNSTRGTGFHRTLLDPADDGGAPEPVARDAQKSAEDAGAVLHDSQAHSLWRSICLKPGAVVVDAEHQIVRRFGQPYDHAIRLAMLDGIADGLL